MFYFNKIPPESFTLIAAFLGVIIGSILNPTEQNVMGNFFMSIGQTMATAATQAENQEALRSQNDMLKKIDDMSTQLESMKKQLRKGK